MNKIFPIYSDWHFVTIILLPLHYIVGMMESDDKSRNSQQQNSDEEYVSELRLLVLNYITGFMNFTRCSFKGVPSPVD